jgi:hypothetical protein
METLIKCPNCKSEGIFSNDIWGVEMFFHKIPSKREGYYTFTQEHSNK